MARRAKKSDPIYNARRRFKRAAQRYEREAAIASGSEASRLRELARINLTKAIRTYENSDDYKKNRDISEMAKRINPKISHKKATEDDIAKLEIESKFVTTNADFATGEAKRQFEAKQIMNSDIGKRIYAATVNIWMDGDYSDRDDAIMEFFGVDNLADLIDVFTESGIDIYSNPDDLDFYKLITTSIALKIADMGGLE